MKYDLILPRPLPKNATLGVIATSSPIHEGSEELIARGYRRLRERGFEVIEAANCRNDHGHTAGTIQERVDALHTFFEDPAIDGIISFWGGLQTHQLLEYLDWELIQKHPKPLVGYSDLTVLTNAITFMTGLVTFSGPAVITFAKPTFFDYSWQYFEQLLITGGERLRYQPSPVTSDNAWYERDDNKMIEKPAPGWRCYRPGEATGPIVGGNLGTLLLLAGTRFWPDLKGCILFVEEDEAENSGTIDRMFTQARQMGIFEEIAGMVVGRFPAAVGFTEEDTLEMILDDSLKGSDFPVLLDVDFGHTDPLLTFPLGVRCRLDAERKHLELVEPWCRER